MSPGLEETTDPPNDAWPAARSSAGGGTERILYLCTQFPWPLDTGQKWVTFQDLKGLSRRFEVHVVSFISDQDPRDRRLLIEQLRGEIPSITVTMPVEHRIHRADKLYLKSALLAKSLIRRVPYSVEKYKNAEYIGIVREQLSQGSYDALYIDHAHPSFVLEELPESLLADTSLVHRAHDALFETVDTFADQLGGIAGVIGRVQAKTHRLYEQGLWRVSDLTLTVTRRLRDLIRSMEPDIADRVVYWPVPIDLPHAGERSTPTEAKVMYLGTVRYPMNLSGLRWFLRECWPRVLDAVPDATFHVAGKGAELLNTSDKSVVLHGYVEDPSPLYESASALVVPLFSGSGIRVKILDSMSRGVPVVTTRLGFAGLELREDEDVLVADDPERFAKHVIRLLQDPGFAADMSRNGLKFLEDSHNRELADQVVDDLADKTLRSGI